MWFSHADLPRGTSLKETRRRFTRLWKNRLERYFSASISALDVDDNGRSHIHALVVASFDLSRGFDKDAYLAMRQIGADLSPCDNERARRRYLGRALTTNRDLRHLWACLRDDVKWGEFAPRFELCPILESPEQAVKYLLKGYYRGVRAVRRDPSAKGVRVPAYSSSVDRVMRPRFASVGNRLWRQQLEVIGTMLGVTETTISHQYGPRWAYRLQYAINELEMLYGAPENWLREDVLPILERFMPMMER